MVKINLHGAVPLTEPCRPGKNYFLHDASLSNNPVFYKKVLTQAKKTFASLIHMLVSRMQQEFLNAFM